jgi:hypothetical protein
MAATLTGNGITFGDSTQLNSKYGIMEQGTVSIFYAANAPVGWTKSTTHNDKALRVVSGSGGVSGGSLAFTSAFPSSLKSFNETVTVTGTLGGTTLTTAQMPSHTHPGSAINPQGANHNHSYTRTVLTPAPSGGASDRAFHSTVSTFGPDGSHTHGFTVNQSSPGGGSHTHPWVGSGPASNSVDTRVKYIDVIICSFN